MTTDTDDVGVEVWCRYCDTLITEIPFEDCFTDRTCECPRCRKATYWVNCPICETGYCAKDKDEPCPGC